MIDYEQPSQLIDGSVQIGEQSVEQLLSTNPPDYILSPNRETIPLPKGTPVANHADGNGFLRAASGSLLCIGLLAADAPTAGRSPVQLGGVLVLSDWTPITGTTQLTPSSVYYVSSTPGKLTTTPPATPQVVGTSLSPFALKIEIEPLVAPFAGIAISAGTLSSQRSDVTFSNSNGVSFGLNTNGVVTATVATNYQSIGAYLTTAGLSQDSSKYAGVNGAISGGSITVNTSGVSVNLPAYLTTAMASNAATISNVNVSAGTTSENLSAITFSNANGVSFGLDTNSVITATVATNYQTFGAYLTTAALSGDTSNYAGVNGSVSTVAGTDLALTLNTSGATIAYPKWLTTAQPVGAYLTTAALSQDSSKYAGTSTAIAGGSLTLNTAGISISLPAYLTTAMQSNAATISNIKVSAGTLSNNLSAVTFADSGGVSWGLNTNSVVTASVQTDYQAAGAYLTTAALSGDTSKYAGTSTGMTGGSVTLNTSGIGISLPAYLTTAALSADSSKYAGINTSVATTAGTDLTLGVNTSGATIGYPKWITTYVNDLTSQRAGTNASVATTAGTDLTLGVNTSGVSIGYPKWLTTYVNDLTSQRAGTNTSVVTTAGTDLSFAVNTSGVTIAYPKWITTAVGGGAGTGFTSTSTAGLSVVGTLDSNGLAMSIPNYITTYANDLTSLRAGINASVATTAGSDITLGVNTSGVTVGYPKWLTTAAVSSGHNSYWANIDQLNNATTTMCQSNSFYVCPLTVLQHLSVSYLRLLASFNFTSTTIATSAVNNVTGASTAFNETVQWNAVLYSAGVGASSRSLQYYYSSSAGLTWAASVSQASTSNASNQSFTQKVTFPNEGANTDNVSTQYSVSATNGPISTTQWSNLSAQRFLDVPFATSLSAGIYWLALNRFSGTAGGKNLDCNASIYGVSNTNLTFANVNSATNLSNAAPYIGLGVWTTNVANTTSSIALGAVSVTTSFMMPMVQFIRQA